MNKKQRLLSEMVLGILVYSVVLGFFNDYTAILQTKSYSITFALSVVLQVLTYLTLRFKKSALAWLKRTRQEPSKLIVAFIVWFIMFSSKFVFIAIIEVLFGDLVQISGFIGLMLAIVAMTITAALITHFYKQLGDHDGK